MIYVAYTIHVIVSLFLIMVVLLQQGKGADLSVFGGGGTQAAFGARGAATLLHKLTVAAFVAFIVTTLTISFLQGQGRGNSVMQSVVEKELKEETTAQPIETTEQQAAPQQPETTGEQPHPATPPPPAAPPPPGR